MSTKSAVLAALEKKRGQAVSGQELAGALGLSRSAVWKAVNALRAEGHSISAVTNGGYKLDARGGPLSAEGIRACLPEALRDREILVFSSTDSTNTLAKRMGLEGAASGTVIAAEEQSSGRGRYGKSFYSPAGTGLYMSLILRPAAGDVTDVQMVTVAAAVAVCQAIETLTGLSPEIKWVNDLYLRGKKICGILTEASVDFESGGVDFIVLGVGVNCATEAFPLELRDIAGSLGKPELSRGALAAEIIKNALACLRRGSADIIEEYKRRSLMPGRDVSFVQNGAEVFARVLDINERGNLVVRDSEGKIRVLSSGEVSVKGAV